MPRLLRPRDDRPSRRAADQRDEIASSHRLPLKQRVLFYHPEGCIVHHGALGSMGWRGTISSSLTGPCVMSALPPKADIARNCSRRTKSLINASTRRTMFSPHFVGDVRSRGIASPAHQQDTGRAASAGLTLIAAKVILRSLAPPESPCFRATSEHSC